MERFWVAGISCVVFISGLVLLGGCWEQRPGDHEADEWVDKPDNQVDADTRAAKDTDDLPVSTDVAETDPPLRPDTDTADPFHPECDVYRPEPTESWVSYDSQNGGSWLYDGRDDNGDLIMIDVYSQYGGPEAPGVYALSDRDQDFDTCGLCMALGRECHLEEGMVQCNRWFMPQAGGEVEILSLGTRPGTDYSGVIRDAVFREVDIDWTTWNTTTVPAGSRYCVNFFIWTGRVQ